MCVCVSGAKEDLGAGLFRTEQPAKCSLTPRIVRQAWLAGGEAFSEVGEGRAEGEHSSAFLCRFCHGSTMPEFSISIFFSKKNKH